MTSQCVFMGVNPYSMLETLQAGNFSSQLQLYLVRVFKVIFSYCMTIFIYFVVIRLLCLINMILSCFSFPCRHFEQNVLWRQRLKLFSLLLEGRSMKSHLPYRSKTYHCPYMVLLTWGHRGVSAMPPCLDHRVVDVLREVHAGTGAVFWPKLKTHRFYYLTVIARRYSKNKKPKRNKM